MGLADSPEVELEIGRVGPQAPHAGWTRSWSASCDRGRLRGSGVRAQMVAGLGPAARLRDDLRSGDVALARPRGGRRIVTGSWSLLTLLARKVPISGPSPVHWQPRRMPYRVSVRR